MNHTLRKRNKKETPALGMDTMLPVRSLTPKQLEANRRNAQKSTGPRTPEGRAVSRMNAVKHGVFSKEALVRGLNFKENSRELAAMSERFRRELNPIGPVEEMLVDQMVTLQWRLRRVLRAESGEIALSVDEGTWHRSRPQMQLRWALWNSSEDASASMEESLWGVRLLQSWITELRSRVEKEGELTEAAVQDFVNSFGGKSNHLTRSVEQLRSKLQANQEGLEAPALLERNKTQALAFLDKEMELLSWQRKFCEKREESEENARQAAAVLPSPEVLDKILRYETALQRQLFRAMSQLERLQRMRQGESVPPPMTMEVSERV
jgi:hypothetical protein